MAVGAEATIRVRESARGEATVLVVDGVLDGETYLYLRDRIITSALNEPSAVIVDMSALRVPAASAFAVFSSARWHVSRWPDVPVLLVCAHADSRAALRRQGTTRLVPVYDSLQSASAAIDGIGRPVRCHRSAEVVSEPDSGRRARQLVTEWLWDWGYADIIKTANVIVTELVDNVYAHTDDRSASLQVQVGDGAITIAVSDRSVELATRIERTRDAFGVSGLQVVAALADAWGCAPTTHGKTVWATITAEG